MTDGIQWLSEGKGSMSSVVFARGIEAEELAVRMGGTLGAGTEPITDAEVSDLRMEIYRPRGATGSSAWASTPDGRSRSSTASPPASNG